MKRIAIVHWEFLDEGLPAALHVNGRTETDFRRWAAFVADRPEITLLAYEFATGTGRAGRRGQHAAWLVDLARQVGRPLAIVVRGGADVLPALAGPDPTVLSRAATLVQARASMRVAMSSSKRP